MKLLWRPKSSSGITFYCFTPLVSLSTFVIEFCFALYVLVKYKPTVFSTLCIITLLCLGVFQLSEFLICTTPYVDVSIKLGYVAITLLPSLGLHIISTLTKRWNFLAYLSYICAAFLIAAIIFIPKIAFLATCNTNYVGYAANNIFSSLHWYYYAISMGIGILLLTYVIIKHIGDRREEKWMIISYFVFIIPSLILFYAHVIAHVALPSVMCGFAILTAIIFVFIIIPRYYVIRSRKIKSKKKSKK